MEIVETIPSHGDNLSFRREMTAHNGAAFWRWLSILVAVTAFSAVSTTSASAHRTDASEAPSAPRLLWQQQTAAVPDYVNVSSGHCGISMLAGDSFFHFLNATTGEGLWKLANNGSTFFLSTDDCTFVYFGSRSTRAYAMSGRGGDDRGVLWEQPWTVGFNQPALIGHLIWAMIPLNESVPYANVSLHAFHVSTGARAVSVANATEPLMHLGCFNVLRTCLIGTAPAVDPEKTATLIFSFQSMLGGYDMTTGVARWSVTLEPGQNVLLPKPEASSIAIVWGGSSQPNTVLAYSTRHGDGGTLRWNVSDVAPVAAVVTSLLGEGYVTMTSLPAWAVHAVHTTMRLGTGETLWTARDFFYVGASGNGGYATFGGSSGGSGGGHRFGFISSVNFDREGRPGIYNITVHLREWATGTSLGAYVTSGSSSTLQSAGAMLSEGLVIFPFVENSSTWGGAPNVAAVLFP